MKRVVTVACSILALSALIVAGCQKKPSEQELFSQAKTAQEAQDFQKAVDAYKAVVTEYPKGDKADEAQFMIGFLYANDLGDTAKARQAYEYFLQNYSTTSDSGMVLSAKWELANLGKDVGDIEQIIKFSDEDGDSTAASTDTPKEKAETAH